MLNDEIKKKINLKKKEPKKSRSQIRLIFKTYDLGHKTGLPHRRRTWKNHKAKFSIIKNKKKISIKKWRPNLL